MPNSDSGQPQTFHPGQQCLVGQSYNASPVFLPSDLALHRVELLFFLYLLLALLTGIYFTYRTTARQRRTQALERLFRLSSPPRSIYSEEMMTATTKSRIYEPIPLSISKPIADTLSALDIPLGHGGFARDYIVGLTAGDQVVIELKSERFDTFVSLLASDGSIVGENDDGPDGTTNSLLNICIPISGSYTVRVQASGAAKAVGPFTLFVRRLRPKSCIQQL
ncbi:MAG: PPC domain-containing protein [Chroococcidiopsidaceae cyanobacterium CP_BM_ER_R8_30]|nr:PPC domain-containing protein [Chroococcidiopsidaceae cyanobacterium CP_BM_ER_R8_30]